MNEQWKKIIINNIETRYSVSNLGNVRNDEKGNILIPFHAREYLVVKLSVGEYEYTKYVHRLVALNFVDGKTDEKNEIDHVDGNKLNNTNTNLEWVTRSEQIKRAYKLNLIKPKKGEENPSNKYSTELIREICELLEKGMSNSEILKELQLPIRPCHYLISNIQRKKNWRHISDEYNIPPIKQTKKYNVEDIEKICQLISSGYEKSHIVTVMSYMDCPRNVLRIIRDIKNHKSYKRLANKYNI